MSGSDQVPGSSGPRWRIKCDARAMALSARAAWAAADVSSVPAEPGLSGPAGAATNASSPHTAPQYAALGDIRGCRTRWVALTGQRGGRVCMAPGLAPPRTVMARIVAREWDVVYAA
jgi:hypothetical protein